LDDGAEAREGLKKVENWTIAGVRMRKSLGRRSNSASKMAIVTK